MEENMGRNLIGIPQILHKELFNDAIQIQVYVRVVQFPSRKFLESVIVVCQKGIIILYHGFLHHTDDAIVGLRYRTNH